MRKFEPIRFNVVNEDIREAYNLKERVDGFFDGEKVRCITYAFYDNEEDALNMKDAWKDSHCEIFPVDNQYAFITSCEDYFLNKEDVNENSVRYIGEISNDPEASMLANIITKYILSLR